MAKFSDLPEGMITEILLRLPVKSLLQCKSVCKQWLSTISDPHFIKSQVRHSIIASRNHPTLLNIVYPKRILCINWEEQQQRRLQLLNQARLDPNAQDLSTSPVLFDRVTTDFFAFSQVSNCVNGIICLSTYEGHVVYLWNPSIRQFKKLAFPEPLLYKYYVYHAESMMLFGYDYISNDYKVVRILYRINKRGDRDDRVPVFQVYSTNADCFREFEAPLLKSLTENIQMVKTLTHMARTNIVVNRVLYFDGGDQLVSFDIHEEVFGLVPFPNLIQRKRSDVLDFEGSVAMVFESGPGVVDLWTLDHVSGNLSWTKKFSFENGLDDSDTELWLSSYLGARQFYGTKLLNENHYLYEVLYDYEKKETKCYGLQEFSKFFSRWRLEYVREACKDSYIYLHAPRKYEETLVSLDGFHK